MFILGEAPEVDGFSSRRDSIAFGIASAWRCRHGPRPLDPQGTPPFDLCGRHSPVSASFTGRAAGHGPRPRRPKPPLRHALAHFEATAGRPLRMSPLYPYPKPTAPARLGSSDGERAIGLRHRGANPSTTIASTARTGSPGIAEEHKACREAHGLDLSSFANSDDWTRCRVALQRNLRANIAVPVGAVTYTQFLNDRAGSKRT